MKICIRCRKTFNEEMRYCRFDGVILINSERLENETGKLVKPATNELLPMTKPFQLAIAESSLEIQAKPRHISTNVLIAIAAIVFLLSVSLALATIGYAAIKSATESNVISDSNVDVIEQKSESKEPMPEPNIIEPSPTQMDGTGKANTEKVSKQTLKGYNGRVIMLTAIVRSAPTMEADEKEVVQLDESVKIGKQSSPNSPWYRVVTASGRKGWMHGSTIEFNN